MKNIFKIILILAFLIPNSKFLIGQVGINDNNASPDASAMLDVKSTTKGMLIPRMTTTQRDAITSPATGLMVYNTTTTAFNYYNGTAWVAIGGDNLGDHTATQNLQLGNHWLSGDGDNEGLKIDGTGQVAIGQANQHNHLFQVSNNLNLHTSIVTNSATVNASNSSNNTLPSAIIDKNDETGWVTTIVPASATIDLGQGKAQRLTHYKIRYQAPSFSSGPGDALLLAPKDWTFEGSNDSLNWTILDTKSNHIFTQKSETFPINNTNAFRYYRIHITDFHNTLGITLLGIFEMELIDTTARQVDFLSISDNGAIKIWDDYAFPTNDGKSGQILQTDGSGSISWINPIANQTADVFQLNGNNLELSLSNDGVATQSVDLSSINATQTLIADADNNTKVQVEKNANDDIIRFEAGGTEMINFSKNTNGDFRLQTFNSNILLGRDAGNANTGVNNVFIGANAGKVHTNGGRNTLIGSSAGISLTNGSKNVFVGALAGMDAVSSSRNTFIGDFAGAQSTGASNTALGASAGSQTSGNNNVFIGDGSAYNNLLGSNNTILGMQAGYNSTGSGNVFIGKWAGYNETGSNKLFIDNSNTATPLIYGDFFADTVKIYGTLGVKDAFHFPIVDGTNGQTLQTDGSGNLSWTSANIDTDNQTADVFQLNGNNLELSLSNDGVATQFVDLSSINATKTLIADADNNTRVQVEKNANDDIIRFEAGGLEMVNFSKNTNNDFRLETFTTNILLGTNAGNANTGTNNVFIGQNAGKVHTNGGRNTLIGSSTGISLTNGIKNVFVGALAGMDAVSSSRNTFIGDFAGAQSTGASNTALGASAGSQTSGNNNVFIGDGSAYNNLLGSNNTILGMQAGLNSTGSGNVFIGKFAGYNETGSNKLFIDNSITTTPLIYGDFVTDTIKIYGTLGVKDAFHFPIVDGTNGQTLQTDGSGNLSWTSPSVNTDNLGDHTASQNLQLNGKWLSNDGGDEGVFVNAAGNVGIGTNSPAGILDVHQPITVYTNNLATNSGGASASSYGSASFFGTIHYYFPHAAIDGNSNSWYTDNTSTGWWQYDFGTGNETVIKKYRIKGIGGPAFFPFNWTFEGSNDASTWTVLDTRTGSGGLINNVWVDFDFSNTTAYRYYRVNISANGGAVYVGFEEIELIGIVPSTQSAFKVSNAGQVTINNTYNLPTADGTANQIIQTDGSGNLSWTSASVNTDNQDLSLSGNTLSLTNDGTTVDLSAYLDADNLGSHTATQNIQLTGNWLSNDGGNEGLSISNTGSVTTSSNLEVSSYLSINQFDVGSKVFLFGDSITFPYGLGISHNQMNYFIPTTATAHVFYGGGENNTGTELLRIKGSGELILAGSNASKATAGNWTANSDRRLKKNIQSLNSQKMLNDLLALKGVTYEWNDTTTGYERPDGTQFGFIAQNIQEVFPTLVTEDNNGYLQTAYGTYDAMTIEAIRALNDKIERLELKNKQLEANNEILKTQVAKIEKLEAMLLEIQATSSTSISKTSKK